MAEEIQNAVASGKEVTVHEKAITAYGFNGFGYTIIDPDTGVGGYLIEGKGSGRSLTTKIGLGIGYTLITLSLTLLIITFAYFIGLILFEYLAIGALSLAKAAASTSLGLLSLSATLLLDDSPCSKSIIQNIVAGFVGATLPATVTLTKIAYFLNALIYGTGVGFTFGGGFTACY